MTNCLQKRNKERGRDIHTEKQTICHSSKYIENQKNMKSLQYNKKFKNVVTKYILVLFQAQRRRAGRVADGRRRGQRGAGVPPSPPTSASWTTPTSGPPPTSPPIPTNPPPPTTTNLQTVILAKSCRLSASPRLNRAIKVVVMHPRPFSHRHC